MPVGAQAAAVAGGEGLARAPVRHQFEGQDHSGLPYFGHVGVCGQRCRQRRHARRRAAVARQHVVTVEDGQRRQRRGATERVAGVAVRVQEGALARIVQEGLVHRARGQHRRHRQEAAGQALGQAEEIRRDGGLLAGEQGARAAEANGDLICDQVRTVRVADLAGAAQVGRMEHAHAAGALHQRLEDQGADLALVCREHGFQLPGTAQGAGLGAFAGLGLVGVGRGREQRLQQQRRIHAAIKGNVAHRQRAKGFRRGNRCPAR